MTDGSSCLNIRLLPGGVKARKFISAIGVIKNLKAVSGKAAFIWKIGCLRVRHWGKGLSGMRGMLGIAVVGILRVIW
jgi:hypothetical protein